MEGRAETVVVPGCVVVVVVGVLDRQPTTGGTRSNDCDLPRSVTRRKRHVAHNLDRFGPRGA
jgi:hypothetical protein